MPDETVSIERVTRVTDELTAAFGTLLTQLYNTPTVADRALLEAVVADPANRLLVARDGTELLGTATVILVTSLRGVHARLEDVVVDERARGRGVGGALVHAAVELAASCHAQMVELTSRPFRAAAQRLYRREGFELVDTNVFRYHLDHEQP